MTKDRKFNFKASEEYLERLHKVADVIDTTASQFVREAIDEKMERLAKKKPKVAEILKAA